MAKHRFCSSRGGIDRFGLSAAENIHPFQVVGLTKNEKYRLSSFLVQEGEPSGSEGFRSRSTRLGHPIRSRNPHWAGVVDARFLRRPSHAILKPWLVPIATIISAWFWSPSLWRCGWRILRCPRLRRTHPDWKTLRRKRARSYRPAERNYFGVSFR